MTTLSARANQAYLECRERNNDEWPPNEQQAAFEEGWETGYKTAIQDVRAAIAKEEAEDLSGNNARFDGLGAADYLAAQLLGEVRS